jgi:hypothetical protein
MFAVTYDSVRKLKSQMLNIIVTQTPSGLLHFDTPKKGQNKDLYSAIILAAHGTRIVEKELEQDTGPVLYNKSGMIRTHQSNSAWNPLDSLRHSVGPTIVNIDRNLNSAVLKKRIK